MCVAREDHEGVDVSVKHGFLINAVQHDKVGKIFFIAGVGVLGLDDPIGKFTDTGNFLRQILMGKVGKKYDLFHVDPFVQIFQPTFVVGFCVIDIAHRDEPMFKIHKNRGGGLVLAGFPELLLPTVIYCTVIWGVGLMVYTILWSMKRCYLLLPVLVIASTAVCPVYADLSLLLPWLEKVRMVVPVYWLWCIPEQQGLWLVIATAVLAAGVSLIVLRCRALLKFKI